MDIILYGKEWGVLVEGVAQFKYLGRTIYQTDDKYPATLWNIKRAWKFWGKLGKMMLRDGADTQGLENFYSSAVQEVLIFVSESWVLSGLELWVLSAAMESTVEGTHTGLLQDIIGKRVQQNPDSTWLTPVAEVILEAAGIQLVVTYIGC